MPIYRGDRKIASIYRGDRKIAKIYRGDRQVYSAKKRVLLFDNIYKAVWVNGDVGLLFPSTPNFDPTIRKYNFKYWGDIGQWFYMTAQSIVKISNSSLVLGGNNNAVLLPTTGTYNIEINKTKLYINESFVQDLVIGNTLETSDLQFLTFNANMKFYEMKIYDNDVLVYHFVPAYTIVNNREQYGVAEMVSRIFSTFPDNRINGEPEYEE